MRRRKLFAAVLAVAATVGLAACGSNDDPNVLKVGTEGTYSPYSYQDNGQLTGYDVEVIKAVGDKIGRKVEFVQTPWDAIFAGLESKRFDLVANQVTINPEREQKYSLSQPYTTSEGVIITKTGNTAIKTLADLSGKTCAQSTTSNWSKVASGAGCKVEGVEGFVQAIQLLKTGRVDASVNDSLAVADYTTKNGQGDVQVAGKTGETSKMAFAARKDSQALTDQINKALDELRADGTLARISEKYFGYDVSK
ncbi:amino acid ABC transporter substrate-binding protein [Nocardia huaxiensis]|uniref:Amino acid ABC transporter substrate-binding protein n=1 Tax=Nocardia huaxiensis TaxID=2755382 RepID=A0A7D6ZTV6_9NOCA|nr:amino acid ABC transporter substrate-binding protein [Nocardia huaxiensis]QLY33745.1 amino acid ABC transporter substrate-binding protein [Nocardia huaxiensis]UFS99330.1 amino acid ABC transporter substrate-binding protein [Nocardia huaxiensis]